MQDSPVEVMARAATAQQLAMLRAINDEDETPILSRSPTFLQLIEQRLVYAWEDGDYELHARVSPTGRAMVQAAQAEGR